MPKAPAFSGIKQGLPNLFPSKIGKKSLGGWNRNRKK
jgi:hypothetical protein